MADQADQNKFDIQDEIKAAIENLGVDEDLKAMQDSAKEIADVATEFIRKYPLQSVVGAAAIGFVLGSWLNRK